jgi:hypothetical protein
MIMPMFQEFYNGTLVMLLNFGVITLISDGVYMTA